MFDVSIIMDNVHGSTEESFWLKAHTGLQAKVETPLLRRVHPF